MGEHQNGTPALKSVGTAFEVLEAVKEHRGARVSTLAEELGLPPSTAHRYLSSLHDAQFLVKKGDEYRLSFLFADFGDYVLTRSRSLQLTKEKVHELAEATEERAQFLTHEHGQAVYVFRKAGENAVLTDPGIGKYIPLHAISGGKAILAEWTDDRVEQFVEEQGLDPITPNTITEKDRFFEELETVRNQGYAVNNQENVEGLMAVGTAIKDGDGEILGAVSVSGPTNRIEGMMVDEELPTLLKGKINELQLNIQYS